MASSPQKAGFIAPAALTGPAHTWVPKYCHTKYGWIYIIRETQNDNLTSDPPSAVILEYRTAVRPEIEVDL
jgi:hypothetical protein